MKAVRYHEFGDEEVLKIEELPEPEPGEGEVLVQIKAVHVAPGDLTFRSGTWDVMPIQLPLIPGTEGAGIVKKDSSRFKAGDAVIISGDGLGILKNGLSAEMVAVNENILVPMPKKLSVEEAATVPTSFLTAYLALTQSGEAKAGEWLLVTGASGGVGEAAIQIGKALGLQVIATVRKPEHVARVKALGADYVIDLSNQKLVEQVKQITGGQGVNLVCENVGGEVLSEALQSLSFGGRLVAVGYAGGRTTNIRIWDLLIPAVSIRGVNLFAAPPEVLGAAYQQILEWLAEGTVKVVINKTFSLEQIKEAHRYVASRAGFGRVVLTV